MNADVPAEVARIVAILEEIAADLDQASTDANDDDPPGAWIDLIEGETNSAQVAIESDNDLSENPEAEAWAAYRDSLVRIAAYAVNGIRAVDGRAK